MDAISGSVAGAMVGLSEATAKQTFGAQVVTATLDKMNTNSSGAVNADYDFQTKVLTAGAVAGKGSMFNGKV